MKKLPIIAAFAAMLLILSGSKASCNRTAEYSVTSEEVCLSRDGNSIYGILYLPEGPTRTPRSRYTPAKATASHPKRS